MTRDFFVKPGRDTAQMDALGLGGVAIVDELMYIGAMALDMKTISRMPEAQTITDETRICFDSVIAVLEEQGLSVRDIVKVNCYLTDNDQRQEYYEEFKRTFAPGPYPKRLTLIGTLAGDCRVELEVMAVRPDGTPVTATSAGPQFHGTNAAGLSAAAGGSRLVFTGASAVDPATRKRVPEADTIVNETKVVIERLERSLGEAGLTLRDLCKVSCFIADENDRMDFIYAYRDLMQPWPYPSRGTFGIGIVGDCRVQIDAIAVRPGDDDTSIRG